MGAPNLMPFGPAAVAQAARLIAAGEPVALPTETVYGLAADATRADAVARIYAIKGRPAFNPLIVHVADVARARSIGVFGDEEERLAAAFWPGPLTLVVPWRAEAGIAALTTAGLATVALRVPAHRAMRAVLAATGVPLAAPSANRSGAISPTRAGHVVAGLGQRVALIVDDGPTTAGVESTIVRDGRVLRPGPVTREMLDPYLDAPGKLGAAMADAAGGVVTAPGQLASHYAPSRPLRLGVTAAASDAWLIGFGAVAGNDTLSATGDLVEAAARLFDALHRADASGCAQIAVAPVPETGLGVAIMDRLRRAAAR